MRNDIQDIIGKNIVDILIGELKILHAVTCIQGSIPSGIRAQRCIRPEQDMVCSKKVISDLDNFGLKAFVPRECRVHIELLEVLDIRLGDGRHILRYVLLDEIAISQPVLEQSRDRTLMMDDDLQVGMRVKYTLENDSGHGD